jgi:hypothetical protein
MSRPFICSLALLVLSLGLAQETRAGSPRLSRISPPGGQRGTTVETHFTGRYLDKPQEVMLYGPGIVVESIEEISGDLEVNGRKERVEPGTRVRVRLKVQDDCPLGMHGMRLRTTSGVTDYQRFFVGPFPTMEEDESTQKRNDKPELAKSVPLNVTVAGRLQEPVDVDLYRVEAKKGQRLSAELEAARLGVERGLPDLHLALLDAQGKPVVAADDSSLHVQDPIVSWIADRDGEFFFAVRHSIYNAANDIYRLHLGTFARPTGVYPAGGRAGETLEVTVLGDPRGRWKQTVTLPSAGTQTFPFAALDGDVSAPSPNMLRVSSLTNVLESEPNDSSEALASVTASELPIAFNGIIEKPGDVDCFRFQAKKGERFKVHALANALGSPLDPTISISALSGKGPTQRATDSRLNQLGLPPTGGLNRDTLDPIIDFSAPADGEYVLKVEDDRGNGGDDFVYRVEIEKETDAVLTYVPLEPENQFTPQARQAINVAVGNRYNTTVSVFSTNRAYSGDMELVAIGLPEGVTMTAPRVTAATTRVPVVFEAAAGTPLQGKFFEIHARPVADAEGKSPSEFVSGFRQTIAMNSYGNNDYYLHTVVDRLAIAVTEPAPFTLEVETPKSALVQNGEMAIKFRVVRAPGFEGAVTVGMEWRPTGVTGATPVALKADQSEGVFLVSAARNAAAGSNLVTLTCVSGGERPGYNDNANRTYVAAAPFPLKVSEPHVEARFARTSIERGKTAKVVVKLTPLRSFEGTAKATLARLPRGVELVQEFQEIKADDKEVTFTLRATSDCLVGNYQGVTLDLSVEEDGQIVRQLCGSGTLRIDTERGVASTK